MSYRIKSINEEKKLAALLSYNSVELFKEAGCIIAGGAITSVFTNQEVNDIDVYFKSEESLFRTLASIFCAEEYHNFTEMEQFEFIYNGSSLRTLMFQCEGQQEVQFMTFKYFDSAEDIFEAFDFTCCMGAFDCASGEFVLHDDFMKHNSQRYLKFNNGTDYPLMSLLRVDKYRKKGFSISKAELLRVAFSCMSLNISTWEELRNHIGGMYGYDMSDVFDETQDFDIANACDQLSNLDEKDIKVIVLDDKNLSLFKIAEKFCDIEIDNKEEVFDDKKYIYKCVNSAWKSPISSSKISYKEGDIIDTKNTGKLFFNKNSDNLYFESCYWVEAEIISGDSEPLENNNEKIVINGQIKIVRTFIYDRRNGEKIQKIMDKYLIDFDE
jgi:hypothetical protein